MPQLTSVEFQFYKPDGSPLADTEFSITLKRSGFVTEVPGVVVPDVIKTITDADGKVIVLLHPSSTPYFLQLPANAFVDEDCCSNALARYKFYVPEVAAGVIVRAQDLFIAVAPSNVPYDEEAILIITEAKLTSVNAARESLASAVRAESAATSIEGDADRAEAARDAAAVSADKAVTFATYADNFSQAASNSANSAAGAATASANARDQSITAKDAAQASQLAAKASETASKASETNAAGSATNSANSANGAAGSATAAANSAAAALSSKNSADTAAGTATTKAGEASTSAGTALTQANRAKTEADRAAAATDGKANKGANTDIRSLAMSLEYPAAVLKMKGIEVVLESPDAIGAGFAIECTNGGAGVLHFYGKDYNGAAVPANRLIGGIGPRPWTGSAYTEHSNTAIHFVSTELQSPSAQGGLTKILSTPNGKTNADRVCVATFNGDGDTIFGNYSQNTTLAPYRGLTVIRTDTPANKRIAGLNLVGNAVGYANQIQSWAVGSEGSYENPIRTQASQSLGIGFGGVASTAFTNARALITLRAHSASDWGTGNTPTQIVFSTTALNSEARTDRWMVDADGKFTPMADNAYSLGSANLRCSVLWAGTSTISTSDARLKSPVFKLNDAELAVSKLMLKEIGMYRFLAAVEDKEGDSREHCGMTVQRVIELFKSVGLDPFKYSFICYDEWEEETVSVPVEDENGETTMETHVKPAGNCYSFRESGLMMFMMAGLVDRLDKLEA